MNDLDVYLLSERTPRFVGRITRSAQPTFSYNHDADPVQDQLSASLPFKEKSFSEEAFRPYFEGLVPEGGARESLDGELGIREDDYLSLLEVCGRECIGDVMVVKAGTKLPSWKNSSYMSISSGDLRKMLSSDAALASENAVARLSLAGTQGKVGLAFNPDPTSNVKWLRPKGLAASTHIVKTSHLRDVPELEYLCMKAASAMSIRAASVRLLDIGEMAIVVERFDRLSFIKDHALHVRRLHQEDFAQAMGVIPLRKYVELPGGSIRAMAQFIRRFSINPISDLEQFSKALAFNFAIGNCDAHLKNYSLVPNKEGDSRAIALSPAYDLVSTTYFPRFSRDMAMAYGSTRSIDEIAPDDFSDVVRALGIAPRAFKSICKDIALSVGESVKTVADTTVDAPESLPFITEDLLDDMQPRLKVLLYFAEGL